MEQPRLSEASPNTIRALPLHDEIARRAEQIWKGNGCPVGRDEEFWLKAEGEVLGADYGLRFDGVGAVSANQYAETTDANGARRKSRTR